MNIQEKVEAYLGKPVAQASNKEIYDGLLTVVQEMAAEKERTDSKKKLYYISAEFLIGTERTSARSRKQSRSRHSETADSDVLQHVSSIPLPHSDLPGTESG